MKRRLFAFALAALTIGLLGSCSKINERIDDLDKRVYDLENNKIASIDQQITAINTSINDLKAADVTINGKIADLKTAADAQQALIDALQEADRALGQKDTELEARIATLEGQVATINGQIDALVNADIAINTRIDELKTYVDTEIGKTKDWAEETFATLEQYQQTADDLAALSVTVTGISTTLAGMQTSISGLDTKIDGINADLQGKITAAKTELEGKITSLKTELEGKIASEISASETSIKSWINELLEGYYTIAQVDAKIGALNTAIETAKSTSKTRIDSVATELTALKKVVDTEKATIRAEYKNAIDVAINKLDGEIRGALLDSVAAVNGRIEALDTRVTTLELKMQTVEGRVDKLEAAIGAYTELQGTITEIIKRLLAEVGDKPQSEQDTTIWKCITALQAQCGTFGTAIETLQGLVGNKDVATQISEAIASLITTQKLEGLADAVSALKDIVYGKGDVKSLTQQIADINKALETTYVTKTQLSQDIAAAKSELQSQIDSLCNVIGADGDATTATGIFKKIAELNARVAALEAVKITIESTEYTNWSDAVQAVLNKVNALGIGNISGLQSALNDLEARLDKIEAMIQSVTILPAYTDGSVEADDKGMLTIDFVVSPAAAVKGVTKDSIKVLVHEAKVQTKAATSYTIIDVESATVDEATGDVTITADISGIAPAEGNGLTVAVNIKNGGISNFTTEAVPVTLPVSVSLDKHSIVIKSPESAKDITLTATVKNSSKGVIWSNSNNDIAAVDNGKVTIKANASGKDTIVVKTVEGNATDTCFITVWPKGALAGEFSVSATKKVYFSKGNLWAKQSPDKDEMYFEENQYSSKSDWDPGHLSLLTWSSTAREAANIGYSGENLFCDVNHKVSVDGSEAIYYALSLDEWKYLINKDGDENIRKGKYKYGVTVCGKAKCLILVPDECLNGYSFDSAKTSYTAGEWATAEAAGLVCLPAAGYRDEMSFSGEGYDGYYWSSNKHESIDRQAYLGVKFDGSNVDLGDLAERDYGYSIRLVTEVK